jgi:hypothetical protein
MILMVSAAAPETPARNARSNVAANRRLNLERDLIWNVIVGWSIRNRMSPTRVLASTAMRG